MRPYKRKPDAEIPEDVRSGPDELHGMLVLLECKTGYRMYEIRKTTAEIVQEGKLVGQDNGGILRRRLAKHYKVPV